jgi:hypothetical protein
MASGLGVVGTRIRSERVFFFRIRIVECLRGVSDLTSPTYPPVREAGSRMRTIQRLVQSLSVAFCVSFTPTRPDTAPPESWSASADGKEEP